jgi:hypothetical protein
MRITEQGQSGLAKKIVPFIPLSFGIGLQKFFILQLVPQLLELSLQRIGILASFGGHLNCIIELRGSRFNFFLKLNLLSLERGELRGKGLQSRNDRSKILKKQKEVTINSCRTLTKKDSGDVRSRCIK